MNNITVWAVRAKRLCKKLRAMISRHFNIHFALKRKKDEDPLLSVNIKGEIPREVVAFFAVLGAFTAIGVIWKVIRKFL